MAISEYLHGIFLRSLVLFYIRYFQHQSFLEPNQILRDTDKLTGIPGTIVQGRYDMICPVESAWQLHHAWPDSVLKVIPDAGHAASEPGIATELEKTCDDLEIEIERDRK